METVECEVNDIRYRRYPAINVKNECEGCVANHARELCHKLGSCGTFDNDEWEDYIWKKV